MIEVSEQFRAAMQQPAKTIRLSVVTDGEIPQIFASSDTLANIEIEATGCYFSTVAKSLTMKLIGTDYDLVDADITPILEAKIEGVDDEWHSCPLGKYRVTEQEADLDKGTMTFKAYDAISRASDSSYFEGDITWPCSVQSLTEQVAEKLHIDLMTDVATLPNSDYMVKEDLYSKITGANYRNILAEIAGATATVCRIHNNKLDFVQPPINSATETLTYDNLLKVKLLPKYGPVNSAVLARTPQEDNVAIKDDESIIEHGLTELKLANNEILDDNREDLAEPIFNAVKGLEYYPQETITTPY